jgi:dihydroneopterin aldolase
MATDELDSLIRVQGLEIFGHIGVPDKERASPQRLTFNLILWPVRSSQELRAEIGRAVNYANVCAEVKKFVEQRRDRLIRREFSPFWRRKASAAMRTRGISRSA